jgi:putative flippase GtrA
MVTYTVLVLFNFLLQKYFTFRSKALHSTELPKFLLLHLLNMTGSWIIMYAATRLGWPSVKLGNTRRDAGRSDPSLRRDEHTGIQGQIRIAPMIADPPASHWLFHKESLT